MGVTQQQSVTIQLTIYLATGDNLPCYISNTENSGWTCNIEGSTYTIYAEGEPQTKTLDVWWMTGCNVGDQIDYFFEVYVYNGCRVWEGKIMRVFRSKTKLVFVKADALTASLGKRKPRPNTALSPDPGHQRKGLTPPHAHTSALFRRGHTSLGKG